jgi:hypothetical protein
MADFVEMARQVLAATACTLSDPMEAGPKECILAETVAIEPMEREGFTTAESAEMPDPTPEELEHASKVLARAGVRLIGGDHGVDYIGVWSDTDSAEVRAALRTYGNGHLPVKYLDGDGIPMKYKLRKVPGEPVPANVLAAMEHEPNQPWAVRDRMLKEMGWSPNGMSWAEWKAQSLDELFRTQGVTGKPGEITARTVRHGEAMKGKLK